VLPSADPFEALGDPQRREILRLLSHEPITYVDAAARVHMAGLEVT